MSDYLPFRIIGLHRNIIIGAFLLFLLLPEQNSLYADEIYLKKGDRISGKVIKKNEEDITVKTQAMGLISIERRLLQLKTTQRYQEKRCQADIIHTV